MSTFDPVVLLPFGLVLLAAVVAAAVAVIRVVRKRSRAKRRVVEKPNSHYASQLARQNEARHRWQNMALDRVHEINREEVVRLLAKVEATGVEALRTNERVFLDHMAQLAGTLPAPKPREIAKHMAPDLRHRPA